MEYKHRIEWLEDQVGRIARRQLELNKQNRSNTTSSALQLGYLLTAVYVVIVFVVTNAKMDDFFSGEMDLNNVGDFLAGLFAPLAFLWLFVGVRIQSVELRNQIDQLTNNVAHQNDIAKSAKSSLDVYKPHLHIERISFTQAKINTYTAPVVVFICPFEFTVVNSGGTARNMAYAISVDTPPKKPTWYTHKFETIREGQQHTFNAGFQIQEDSPFFTEEKTMFPKGISKIVITLFGVDEIGRPFRQDFLTNGKVIFNAEIAEGKKLNYHFHEIRAIEIDGMDKLPEVVATVHNPIVQ